MTHIYLFARLEFGVSEHGGSAPRLRICEQPGGGYTAFPSYSAAVAAVPSPLPPGWWIVAIPLAPGVSRCLDASCIGQAATEPAAPDSSLADFLLKHTRLP